MFFQDVSPGDPRLPESAERYNAVNRLLNSCGDHHSFAGEGSFNGNIIIDFCNISDREILPFTPVSLDGAMDKESLTMLRERFSGGSYTAVKPAENRRLPWQWASLLPENGYTKVKPLFRCSLLASWGHY